MENNGFYIIEVEENKFAPYKYNGFLKKLDSGKFDISKDVKETYSLEDCLNIGTYIEKVDKSSLRVDYLGENKERFEKNIYWMDTNV